MSKGVIGNTILFSVSVLIGIGLLEWTASFLLEKPAAKAARDQGVEFDTRMRVEVVRDCRNTGVKCYPTVPPNTFLTHELTLNGARIQPLAGLADVDTIGCNESGFYNRFHTDEYGFRNPKGSWQGNHRIDIAFVGDSFTQGDCVNDGSHFIDLIRPEFNTVLNLGAGGNGPLIELATIKEYLVDRSLGHLFWVFYEGNDLLNLEQEKRSELLMSYLEDGSSQLLRAHHKEVDRHLRHYVEQVFAEKIQNQPLILPNLRELVWKIRNNQNAQKEKDNPSSGESDFKLFEHILLKAKQMTENAGGRLVVVYLPGYAKFTPDSTDYLSSSDKTKKELIRILANLELDLIDVEEAFRATQDPLDLFPFRTSGHYNQKGYGIVADSIKGYLGNGTYTQLEK